MSPTEVSGPDRVARSGAMESVRRACTVLAEGPPDGRHRAALWGAVDEAASATRLLLITPDEPWWERILFSLDEQGRLSQIAFHLANSADVTPAALLREFGDPTAETVTDSRSELVSFERSRSAGCRVMVALTGGVPSLITVERPDG